MREALDFRAIEERVKAILRDHLSGFSSRYGYEPGTNIYELARPGDDEDVLQRAFGGESLPTGMAPFFSYFSRFSFPDIQNGYFIGPPSWMAAIYENAEPRGISNGTFQHDLISIGSDGGGNLFAALASRDSAVYRLPEGRIRDGLYVVRPGKSLASLEIADSFNNFISKLIDSLERTVRHQADMPY
jgi:hypothetical protein